jgi:hypothetical protein
MTVVPLNSSATILKRKEEQIEEAKEDNNEEVE